MLSTAGAAGPGTLAVGAEVLADSGGLVHLLDDDLDDDMAALPLASFDTFNTASHKRARDEPIAPQPTKRSADGSFRQVVESVEEEQAGTAESVEPAAVDNAEQAETEFAAYHQYGVADLSAALITKHL